MKALVGIDGSPGSFSALRQTARLLSPAHDTLVIYYSPPEGRGTLDPQMVQRGRTAMAEAVFEAAKEELPPAFLGNLSTVTGDRSPRSGLVETADQVQADLIAVGARGMGPIERLLVGSVSQAVIQSAKVPVLVAREHATSRAEDGFRVIVACDGSPTDERLTLALQPFAWPADTAGRLLTVVEPQFAGEVPDWLMQKARSPETEAIAQGFEREFESEKRAKRENLAALTALLPAAFSKLPPTVAEGNPAEQILHQVASDRADLVVVGTRGLNALARWFLGSTSIKVIEQAPCSVLVVRHHERT